MEKCRVEGMRVIPCKFLQKASKGSIAARKSDGVFEWNFANLTSPERNTRVMFGVRSGEYKKGLIFNYCPFCGSDLKESHPAAQQEGE